MESPYAKQVRLKAGETYRSVRSESLPRLWQKILGARNEPLAEGAAASERLAEGTAAQLQRSEALKKDRVRRNSELDFYFSKLDMATRVWRQLSIGEKDEAEMLRLLGQLERIKSSIDCASAGQESLLAQQQGGNLYSFALSAGIPLLHVEKMSLFSGNLLSPSQLIAVQRSDESSLTYNVLVTTPGNRQLGIVSGDFKKIGAAGSFSAMKEAFRKGDVPLLAQTAKYSPADENTYVSKNGKWEKPPGTLGKGCYAVSGWEYKIYLDSRSLGLSPDNALERVGNIILQDVPFDLSAFWKHMRKPLSEGVEALSSVLFVLSSGSAEERSSYEGQPLRYSPVLPITTFHFTFRSKSGDKEVLSALSIMPAMLEPGKVNKSIAMVMPSGDWTWGLEQAFALD